MSRVVVVGGGFGGLAAAVRLAKLGHAVTLIERSSTPGGALSRVEHQGFGWDAGPTRTLLPAVVRDLFRKSGRPIERELALEPCEVVREHRFADATTLRLPVGRAAQLAELDALGPGLGRAWVDHVASYADDWDVLRRGYLENPWRPDQPPRELAALLGSRESLHRRLRRTFADPRLRLVAAHPLVDDGHDPRRVPAWLGVTAYVEQRFGAWAVEGGMAALGAALVARLATRGVVTITDTTIRDLVVRAGHVVAVATDGGEVDAQVVVCAVDPRQLPALAPHVARTQPAPLPDVTHLGLAGESCAVADELVLHGDPLLVVRPGGTTPPGASALTVHARGAQAEDVVDLLARRGLDLRSRVVARVDRSPQDQLAQYGGSPLGVRWQGRATVRRRLGPRTPIPGVYAAGAHATPGAGLPFVGLSAALVAAEIGPA